MLRKLLSARDRKEPVGISPLRHAAECRTARGPCMSHAMANCGLDRHGARSPTDSNGDSRPRVPVCGFQMPRMRMLHPLVKRGEYPA